MSSKFQITLIANPNGIPDMHNSWQWAISPVGKVVHNNWNMPDSYLAIGFEYSKERAKNEAENWVVSHVAEQAYLARASETYVYNGEVFA